jgi:hypothetical protein
LRTNEKSSTLGTLFCIDREFSATSWLAEVPLFSFRAAEWFAENQKYNYSILALHYERSLQTMKYLHFIILASQDALNRFAVAQAVAFLQKAYDIITQKKLLSGLASSAGGDPESADANKKPKPNQVAAKDAQPSEAGVLHSHSGAVAKSESKELDQMERIVAQNLSKGYIMVRR